MKTFKLDESNNLVFGSNIELISDRDALIQDIRTLLLMWKTENPFNTSEGLNYYELLQGMNKDTLENAIITRLKTDSRIKSVKVQETTQGGGTIKFSLQIATSWGEIINV